jgi:hypothetical protein
MTVILAFAVSIVLPAQPTASEAFAARELKYHLEKASGGDVSIMAEGCAPGARAPDERRFCVGNWRNFVAIVADLYGWPHANKKYRSK